MQSNRGVVPGTGVPGIALTRPGLEHPLPHVDMRLSDEYRGFFRDSKTHLPRFLQRRCAFCLTVHMHYIIEQEGESGASCQRGAPSVLFVLSDATSSRSKSPLPENVPLLQ